MSFWRRNKAANNSDMVVQPVSFLFVNVVEVRDLPPLDTGGSLDPFVEVNVGNQKGIIKHLGKNQLQCPGWNGVLAFPKERLQSNWIDVTVKNEDVEKDDFVGKVVFHIMDAPLRYPPYYPVAPKWFKLGDKELGKIKQGEILLAIWRGSQADEAFPEAWHSDAHSVDQKNLANTRSKVYLSPNMYYLRIHVLKAQDLIPSEKDQQPIAFLKIKVGNHSSVTKPTQVATCNPVWDEELMFVVAEPFDEYIKVSVQDSGGPEHKEIGRLLIPVRGIPLREEVSELPAARCFKLHKPSVLAEGEGGTIHLRVCIEAGYNVLDESNHFRSNLQPSSTHLRKPSIGRLELGIMSARNLVRMNKCKDGRTTNAYCVAKYGNKWVRTRTILDTVTPRWNEKYTWEVYDPCTVLTVGVFDNYHIDLSTGEGNDYRIGKVRIRLSTLETDHKYSHFYRLWVLRPDGLKDHGDLHLVIRFTCTAWINMVTQYGRPLLPKMHYVQPITGQEQFLLYYQGVQTVATRLSRAEPPLKKETVKYMSAFDSTQYEFARWTSFTGQDTFSLRRSKANFNRIMSLLSGMSAARQCFDDICHWKNPLTTIAVHVLFFIQVRYPLSVLPNIFVCLFVIGLWNYQFRPRLPSYISIGFPLAENVHDPDEVEEEFDTFPTSQPIDIVRMRYDRLRSVAGWVFSAEEDVAIQGERALSIVSWKDPRATFVFIILALLCSVVLYLTPTQVVQLTGLYLMRHPLFRSKLPSVAVNFFNRLPAKSDMLL